MKANCYVNKKCEVLHQHQHVLKYQACVCTITRGVSDLLPLCYKRRQTGKSNIVGVCTTVSSMFIYLVTFHIECAVHHIDVVIITPANIV